MKQLSGKIKKFFSQITVKQIVLIILFGLVLSIASCIIGYYEFSSTIRETYYNQVEEIAQLVKQNIDISEYEKDMQSLGKDFYLFDQPNFESIAKQPGYQNLVRQAQYLQNSVEGLDIFVGDYKQEYTDEYLKYLEDNRTPEDEEAYNYLKYDNNHVVCCYYRTASLTPSNRKVDFPGGLFIADGQEDISTQRVYQEKQTQYAEDEMILGDTHENFTIFSAKEPFFNSKGDIIGFVNVSLTINVLHALLSRYLILVGFLTILIGIIFILLYIHINRKMFIQPILSIIRSTSSFVENNNQISEALEDIKTGDEIQTLAESILQLEKDINEYIKNLAEATKERERVQAELDLATNIQMSMLPQEIPEVQTRDEFEIAAIMNPAREVGGDFYNYFLIDDDHLGFVVGDVSGKGVPAALFMMIGTILIKTHSLPGEAVDAIMEKVNDILSDNNAEMLFITAWMGIYEISTGKVTFINAGHEPPVLAHANGEVEFVKTQPNLALATFGGIPYTLREIQLKKGDKIFLYTDGVAEAQNEKQEFYQNQRFADLVQKNYKEDLNTIIKIAREDIDNFAGEAEQFDDITIVGLEVKDDPKR